MSWAEKDKPYPPPLTMPPQTTPALAKRLVIDLMICDKRAHSGDMLVQAVVLLVHYYRLEASEYFHMWSCASAQCLLLVQTSRSSKVHVIRSQEQLKRN